MSWPYLLLGLIIFSYLILFVYKTKTGSPYLPSRNQEIALILKHIPSNAIVCDLGAGDGRIMQALLDNQKAKEVWGWEIEPLVWLKGWLNFRRLKPSQRAKIHYHLGDMWRADFSPFDVLIVYQLERFTQKLADKCKREMKPGSLIIANTYPIKGLKKLKQDGKILIYTI